MSIGKENINIFYGLTFNHFLLIVSSSYLVCFLRNLMSSSVNCCFTQHIPILDSQNVQFLHFKWRWPFPPCCRCSLPPGHDHGWCLLILMQIWDNNVAPAAKRQTFPQTPTLYLTSLYTHIMLLYIVHGTCKYCQSLNSSNILKPWHYWCTKVLIFSYFIFKLRCSHKFYDEEYIVLALSVCLDHTSVYLLPSLLLTVLVV